MTSPNQKLPVYKQLKTNHDKHGVVDELLHFYNIAWKLYTFGI